MPSHSRITRELMMSSVSCDDSPLKKQLMSKIADQANELAKINVELVESRAVMDKIENRNIAISNDGAGISRDSQRKRIEKEYKDKFIALEKQLAQSNSRLNESSKARNQQVTEMEKISREYKFFKQQTTDLQKETQTLRSQLHTKDKLVKKLKANAHEDPEPIRQELDKANSDLAHVFAENDELKLKIRVLEDALEFRAEEIGLAGHADLLSKIAHFRGEVSALKNDLQSKHVKLETVMSETSAQRERNEQLNENVSSMQVRLMEAKNDMSRLQGSSDLLEQLKGLEAERDVLVDYIQGDMKKSAAVTEKLDASESKYHEERTNRLSVEKQLELCSADLLERDKELLLSKKRCNSLAAELEEVKRENHRLEGSVAEVRVGLERKSLEANELFEMQTSLLAQTKDKDNNCSALESSMRESTAKHHDLQLQLSYSQKDNDMLAQKNETLREEVLALTEQVKQLEPRLLKIEPEHTRLVQEREEWSSQRGHCERDLQEYRSMSACLDEVNHSLQSLSSTDNMSEQNSDNCGDRGSDMDTYSLSQRHVMWCGIPALRRLSPLLHSQIRAMFQDLRQLEKDLRDCRDDFEVDVDDLKSSLKKKTREMDERESIVSDCKSQLARAKKQLQKFEEEAHEKREACAVLDNIRIVLKSSASTVINEEGVHREGRSWAEDAISGGAPPDMSLSGEAPLDDVNLQQLSEQCVEVHSLPTHVSRNVVASAPDKEHEELKNRDLPAALSRALVQNLDSVTKVAAYEQELSHLRCLTSSLQREKSVLAAENEGLKESSRCSLELSQARESEHSSSEEHSKHALYQAAELTERQNGLIAKLEDKLTEFRRKMLLKASQVTSLQQRESGLQKRLFQSVTAFSHMTGTKVAVSDESGLPELVKVVAFLLQDAITDIQEKKFAAIPVVAAENEPPQRNVPIDSQHTDHPPHVHTLDCFLGSHTGGEKPPPQQQQQQQRPGSQPPRLPSRSSPGAKELWEPLTPGSCKRRPPPQPPGHSSSYRHHY